ncbi:chlorohydrolase [Streptococcus pneumoniae]|nr:chlorohydrolase [Streptococcus pneumoniae]
MLRLQIELTKSAQNTFEVVDKATLTWFEEIFEEY